MMGDLDHVVRSTSTEIMRKWEKSPVLLLASRDRGKEPL